MQPPDKIILSKRGNYRMGCVVTAICLIFLVLALGLSLLTGAKPDELLLPTATLGFFVLVILLFIWGGVALSVVREGRQIRAVLEGEQWACWQYTPQEWQRETADLRRIEISMMKPHYNLIVGPLLGLVIAGAAFFGVDDPQVKPIMFLVAGGVTLLFLVTGFFLPLFYRWQANARFRQLSSISAPRLFIAPSGLYHEAKGFTSLENLVGVDYLPDSHPIIIFTVHIRERRFSLDMPVPVSVPAAAVKEAAPLVQRFRDYYRV